MQHNLPTTTPDDRDHDPEKHDAEERRIFAGNLLMPFQNERGKRELVMLLKQNTLDNQHLEAPDWASLDQMEELAVNLKAIRLHEQRQANVERTVPTE